MKVLNLSKRALQLGSYFLILLVVSPVARAQTTTWVGAGANSFMMVNGTTTVTATNGCNGETITAEFDANSSPVNTPFPQLTAGDTIAAMGMNLIAIPGSGPNFALTFGGGFPVENLVFDLHDVDQLDNSGSAWTDRLTITALFGATAMNVNLACVDPDTVCSHTIVSTGGTSAVVDGDFNNATFADINGVVRVTIPGPLDSVAVTYEGLGPGSSTQFVGFSNFAFDCSVVPVTLSSFESRVEASEMVVEWTTATETANVGFYLYGETAAGWERLSDQLVPSRQLDSLVPQSYAASFDLAKAQGLRQIALAEVDFRGRERRHGPYAIGETRGWSVNPEPIAWNAIRAEHRQSAQQRLTNTVARFNGTRGGSFPEAELSVEATGLYRVTYDELLAAGVNLAGAPVRSLALTSGGLPVPIRVISFGGRGSFRPGSYVEFLGEGVDSLYTRTNIYRLQVDASKALRVRESSAGPGEEWSESYLAETEVEENLMYSFASPNGDPWYAASLLAFTTPISRSFNLPVEDLVGDGRGASLRVNLWGVTDWPNLSLDHHVQVLLNGQLVADQRFDGLVDAPLEVDLPAGTLREGENDLTLVLPGDSGADFDLVHLESYGVAYPRRFIAQQDSLRFEATGRDFRVEGFSSPRVVVYVQEGDGLTLLTAVPTVRQGSSYTAFFKGQRRERTYWVAAASALLRPEIRPARPLVDVLDGAADYLIISHPHFLSGLEELVAARRAQGYRVKVVDVEDLYLRYTHGIFDPEAIRLYLADARRVLGTRLVLLVGGDSYDYHDYLGIGSRSFVPTLYTPTHPVVRFTPADALLADTDRDELPDLALGRWPVRTLAELERVVTKTLQAPSASPSAVFAADMEDPPISFEAVSEELIEALPGHWSVARAFLGSSGVAEARGVLLDELNAGTPLVSYFGHSGPMAWTFENLFTTADAAALTNQGAPFVALQWGCWNGYHSVPQYDTVSHALLLSDGGASAAFGAATLTEASSDAALAREVFARAFVPGVSLGTAILEAKRAVGAGGGARDVVLGMTLLGDPALLLDP